MARKVFVSSDMSNDERLIDVAEHNPQAALIWPWLLTAFDDWGRAVASPKRLKASMFPMIDTITPEVIAESIELYAKFELIIHYEIDGKQYMECIGWNELQYGGRPPRIEWNKLRNVVFERDDYTCRYCGKRGGDLECDHVIPVSKGGSNELDNLVTACKKCNRKKSNKLAEDMMS